MKDFTELTHHSTVDDWVMQDVYADLILDGVVCYGQLSGVITAMEYDFTAGGGNMIQVRAMSARTTSCTSYWAGEACAELSATSATMKTYNIKVAAWGDYDLLCHYSLWESTGPVKEMIAKEMSKRMAECRDEELWSNLATDAGATSVNVDIETAVPCQNAGIVGSCCTFAYNLYNSIVSVQKHMQGDAYKPDFVIMHPEVSQYLYMKDGSGYHVSHLPTVKFTDQGQLDTIAGMKVIECCNANKCTGGTGAVMAVVIDSSRALGEVWGKRPTLSTDYINISDSTRLVLWQYWGSAVLDPEAIGWISNP